MRQVSNGQYLLAVLVCIGAYVTAYQFVYHLAEKYLHMNLRVRRDWRGHIYR
jgi:hypothetical protein